MTRRAPMKGKELIFISNIGRKGEAITDLSNVALEFKVETKHRVIKGLNQILRPPCCLIRKSKST